MPAGGPLALGDIEEIHDKPCLVCPWHFYSVALEDGQKFYRQATVQDGRAMAGDWQSVGVRQRTHEVEAREDGLWVRLSTWNGGDTAGGVEGGDGHHACGRIESDRYAFEQETGDRIWSLAKCGNHSSGNGCSPRSTPPESPQRERGGLCGMSSESEDVWPVGAESGDVSSRERFHLQASPRRADAAQTRAPSR
jgi:nitrite reductase/ring-hydroxylating ferredoxin subunit